jgi:hypothetical protein
VQVAVLLIGLIAEVLLVYAANNRPASNPWLLVSAAALAIILAVWLLALGVRWLRARRHGAMGVVRSAARPPILPDPSAGMETVVLPGSYQRTTKVDPHRPRPRTSFSAVLDSQEQEQEREAIQRDARQVRDHYRAMTGLNGIENMTGDVKRSMQVRVDQLNDRLAEYRAKWDLPAVDASVYVPEQPEVGPGWLRAMIRELDVVVWQLDHEVG